MNGTELLADFRATRSEGAFAELVRRYTNLVYSVARRRLLNDPAAEEAAQTVFIRLAQAAPKLRGDAELVAWLHRTTVHVSIDLWRSESRRRAREEKAAAMRNDVDENVLWAEMAPELDEALNELTDTERQTILLRFFDGKTMRELGAAIGVSEDAAKMRVSRALDRLRGKLSTRGFACSPLALGKILTDRAVEVAPGSLVAALMCFQFPLPATVSGAGAFVDSLSRVARTRLVAGLSTALLVGLATIMFFRPAQRPSKFAVQVGQTNQMAGPASHQQLTDTPLNVTDQAGESQPDPLSLLRAVARARQKIASGSMEFQIASDDFTAGRTETNQFRVSVLFDGQKLRWEQIDREYRYTAPGDAAMTQEARIQREGMDKDAAVRAGLLQGFEAHSVTAYDGGVLLTYGETDGKPNDTVINDPNKGGNGRFTFDPRCLGLKTYLSFGDTVEGALGLAEPKAIELIGKEALDGIPAWHVQVRSKYDDSLDFWIDAAHPTRVIKHATGPGVVTSKYSGDNPIPIEAMRTESRNGSPLFKHRWIQSGAQFNVPVDPASWSLAGLGMPVGTPVVDVRISRRIGYWTGAGLSETTPRKGTVAVPAPNVADLLATLESEPQSALGLETAAWIVLNTPDGPEVVKAAGVILREHTQNTNLVHLCNELEHVRPRCTTNLLTAILKNNPSPVVRATACFHLAALKKEQAKFGLNKTATEEAEQLFERVVTEFAGAGPVGADLARRAKPELEELRHLNIGMPAPETEGLDLEGNALSLREFRSKVVVLAFWCCGYSEASDHRKLVERLREKPFALIGVSGDSNIAKAKTALEKYGVTWPSFWENGMGPIHERWNVHKWLSTFVLDGKGVIRYRDVRDRDLSDAVDTLLQEESSAH